MKLKDELNEWDRTPRLGQCLFAMVKTVIAWRHSAHRRKGVDAYCQIDARVRTGEKLGNWVKTKREDEPKCASLYLSLSACRAKENEMETAIGEERIV